MNKLYAVKVRYTKQLEDGGLKRVTEIYLVAAMSFTDAEARIFEELGEIIRGEFNVSNITPVEIHDIFAYDDADTYYRAKVQYDSIDADSEKAKKVTQTFLITADNITQATERLSENLKGLLVDYKLKEMKESNIVDVFPFKAE